MMVRIKVLLVEDHTIVRKGIRSILEKEPVCEVIAEASDGREAVIKVDQYHPDVVLMDISMPGLNGLEATRQIKERYPEINVLVMTMYETKEHVFQLLRAGASGYLVKNSAPKELVQAIKIVAQGESYLGSTISKTVIDEYVRIATGARKDSDYDTLTDREREVLQAIAEGKSSGEIAAQLHISPKTVRNHKSNLMKKLNIFSVAELTQYAIRKGIIKTD